MRQGRITKAQGDLKNRPICHKTSVKKKTSSQDCCGGTFESEAIARPCYFRRGHTCPPCAPIPRAIWGHPQPEFCPHNWRAFLGGTDGEEGERGRMCVLARGKPPGSGQSLPKEQSHSDERLIAIVFLFSEGRAPIPRARLQCGTGWLCLVAVRPLSSRRPRLTQPKGRSTYLASCHPRTGEGLAAGGWTPLCPAATLPPSPTAHSRGDEAPICAELPHPALNLFHCLPPRASCCPH